MSLVKMYNFFFFICPLKVFWVMKFKLLLYLTKKCYFFDSQTNNAVFFFFCVVNSLLCHLFQIQHMYRCARVQGLDTSEGLLLFGKEHFYVIDGYTMTMSREIRDIDTLPPK